MARVSTSALIALPVAAAALPAHADPAGAGAACRGAGEVTVEEARLDGAVPQEILRRSGFDGRVADFAAALCGARNAQAAQAVVRHHGSRLWRAAVDRVQGHGRATGDLSAGDDRPLYWARLGMTAALRTWEPHFELGGDRRADLVAALERWSRGHHEMRFPADSGVIRVVVTGFDPFGLDNDIRQANPSGAAALALDGTTIETDAGTALVRTAMFPVRWRDFTDGMVEQALLPHYTGDRPADVAVTVSQGRDGRFDLEAYNGAWRGGGADNEMTGTAEQVPVPDGVPTVEPQPQWSESTLPHRAIAAAATGPFPVFDNTEVTEIPAGRTEPVVRPDGPTPGSRAVRGGGGDYLSNEIAYRNTLLRDATGRDIPAGHVHTPILRFGPHNAGAVTDPVFERDRTRIVEQVDAIVAEAVAHRRPQDSAQS
ncbi:pyroglutamyl peptidase [Nocardiopsis mwathae]|uniref:pyroglutamyl peptidase n=1 Tax=Nocardiopsis mwathae TaxID=1472723 RepID=UPI003742286A